MKKVKWALVAALACAALLSMTPARYTGRALWHYLRGNAGTCTLAESIEGAALYRRQVAKFNELRAASRVVRRDGTFTLWRTPAGEYWMPVASGEALLSDLAEQARDIYGTRIRPGDVVLDAGANVGVFTRKALAAGASRVIAIEPALDNLECLRRNFASEIAEGQVTVYPKGVWDKDDVLKLWTDPTNSAADTFVGQFEDSSFIEAPLTTIDQLVEELHLTRVNFIKMDIEGAEQKAIVGAQNTIARFRPRMALCTYHLEDDPTMVPKLVHDVVPDYHVSKSCRCTPERVEPQVAFFY